MNENRQEILRKIPQIEKILMNPSLRDSKLRLSVRKRLVQEVIGRYRKEIIETRTVPSLNHILDEIRQEFSRIETGGLKRAINATGVLLHTNLGRAPLGTSLLRQATNEISGYCTLEVDLETGERGSRTEFAERSLSLLFGSENHSSLLVNNNAAALFLILHAFSRQKSTVISRGEIVQIGGGFKIHEILESSGALLKEVGTTNITRLEDYKKSIDKNTALILKVHQSCFAISGHVHETSITELSQLASKSGIPLVTDLGSGGTQTRSNGDPTINQVVRAGSDLTCFSADKLLGASQAGIIIGKPKLILQLKKNPLYRALRIGKMDLFLIEQTLKLHLMESPPLVQTLIDRSLAELQKMAEKVSVSLTQKGIKNTVKTGTASIGGGTTPKDKLPTFLIKVPVTDSTATQRKLLRLPVPIFVRKTKNAVLLDVRSLIPGDEMTVLDEIPCLS